MLTSTADLSQTLGTIHGTILPTRCSAEAEAIYQQTGISIQTLAQKVCSLSGILPPRVFADLLHLEAWKKTFPGSPSGPVDPNAMPKSWTKFIENAINENKIPNIPPTNVINDIPTYPSDWDPSSPAVCSGSVQCRIEGDYWDAPDGEIALGFDDGPWDVSRVFLFSTQIIVSPAVVLSDCQNVPSD
jgi:hypothetical protein